MKHSFTMKTEVGGSSEILTTFYQTIRRHISENRNINAHRSDNLRLHAGK
jgi:hypothetical protein